MPLNDRLFQAITLFAAAMALLVIAPFNHFQNLSPWLNVVVCLFGLTALWLWWESRRGRCRPTLLLLVFLLVLSACWFINGGSVGSIPYYFFDAVLVPVIFTRRWRRAVLVVLVAANVLALFALEHAFPEWVVPFATQADQTLDLGTGLLVCLMGIVVVASIVVGEHFREQDRLTDLNARLQQSLEEVRTLRGLLPICAWCKKVRDDRGLWRQIEEYVTAHSEAAFTHGVCPDCFERSQRELDAAMPARKDARADS
jgi:hypothetical protein